MLAASAPSAAGHWEQARQYYQAVVDDPRAPQVLKDEAAWQIQQLVRAQTPIRIEAPRLKPASAPTTTTAPAATLPAATLPTTSP